MAEDIIAQTVAEVQAGLKDAVVAMASGLPGLILGLVIALLFVIVGWVIGKFIEHVVTKVLASAKLDDWANENKLTKAVGNVPLSVIAGNIAKWYVVLIFITEATRFVELEAIRTFMNALVFYLPGLLGALIIIILGLLAARYVRNLVEATQHRFRKTAGLLGELAIVYVAIVMGLENMGFSVTILLDAFRIAFAALAITVAIIIGVSFGLAFRKDAKQIVSEFRREFGRE